MFFTLMTCSICSCLLFFRWVLLGISLAENRRRERKIKKKKAAESATDFKWAEDMRNTRLEREKVFDISILGITSTQTERQEFLDNFVDDDENDEEEDEEVEKQSDEETEEDIFKGTRRHKKQRRDGKVNKSFSNHRRSKKRQKEETSDSEDC